MNAPLALRLALRGLRADRATSLSAVGILSLGLTAPAVFFSILWGGGLRPLPVPEGDRVVRVEVRLPAAGGLELPADGVDVDRLSAASALVRVGGFRTSDLPIRTTDRGTHRVPMAEVVPGTLELLGVRPLLGRIPDGTDATDALVLGHRSWIEIFDGAPDVIGVAVRVGEESRTVTAVMPEGFAFPFNHHGWTVARAEPDETGYEVVGRLADGASLETATRQVEQLWRQSDETRAPDRRGAVVRVRGFTHGRGEGGEAVAFGGLVLVGLCLLLIAVANTTSLLLVRAIDRVRVLGVQAALGASRLQMAGQMFAESFVLAVVGGAVGVLMTAWMIDYVQTTGSANFGYYWMEIRLDAPVLLFSACMVLGASLVASMLPIAAMLRIDVQQVLKSGDMARAPGRFGFVGRILVGAQLAVACGALVAAALTGQALNAAGDFGRGLPSEEILVASLDFPAAAGDPVHVGDVEALLRDVRRRPGVEHAALALAAPGYFEGAARLEVEGEHYETGTDRPRAIINAVTPDFDGVVSMSLLRGRSVSGADGPDAPRIAVVSRSLAERIASEGDALGRRLRVPTVDSAWATVVGVFEDLPLTGSSDEVLERVHFSFHQVPAARATLVARSAGTAEGVAGEVRSAIWATDPDITLSETLSLAEGHRFMTRAQSTLNSLGVAGGIAGLLVAVVGLFALLSFHVRQRFAEFGVRMALGADRLRVVRHILEMAGRQLVPAVLVGSVAAWVVAPALGPLLLGADPRGLETYLGTAAVFLATGMSAALLPALRAARTRPSDALAADGRAR